MSPPRGETPAQAKARERIWERDLLDSFSKERAAALLKKFAENNTWQVPTLVLLMDLAYVTPTTAHHNDPRLKFVPESVREVWDQGRQQALQGRSAADFEFRTELRKRSLQIVGKMDAAGIPIMAGTDAAAPNVFPGFGLQEELSYLVLAGLTPQQALRSATVGPAEFLNRTETQGTIAPGKRADLVLLDGNPLDDITNTQHIRAVVVNGKAFERNGLDQLLNSAANFAARH